MSNPPTETSVPQNVRSAIGLITEEQVAETLLLRSVDTLATWRSQRKGPPYVKLGKRVFYTINDLGGWIGEEGRAQIAARAASDTASDTA